LHFPSHFTDLISYHIIKFFKNISTKVLQQQFQQFFYYILAPPQAFPATISCQTPNTVTTQLIASSNDTSKPKLSYLLQTHPIFGASVLDQNTGLLTFQCTSTEGGSETLQWYVYDGYSTGFNTINITVTGVPPPAPGKFLFYYLYSFHEYSFL